MQDRHVHGTSIIRTSNVHEKLGRDKADLPLHNANLSAVVEGPPLRLSKVNTRTRCGIAKGQAPAKSSPIADV
jgi:hypothetical protein